MTDMMLQQMASMATQRAEAARATQKTQKAGTAQQGQKPKTKTETGEPAEKAEDFATLLHEAAAQGQQAVKKTQEEVGGEAAAELLAIDPMLLSLILATGDLSAAEQLATQQMAQSGAVSTELQGLLQQLTANQAQTEIPVPMTPLDDALATDTAGTTRPTATGAPQTTVTDLLPSPNPEPQPGQNEMGLAGQGSFERAVETAQRLLGASDPAKANSSKMDIDALQKQVDAGEYLRQPLQNTITPSDINVTAEQGGERVLDAQDIFAQLQAGVTQQVRADQNEFSITLKPEGLGEITVKMMAEGGKIMMSLTASDQNVQKLLGSELNALREVMRPYQVEVTQVEAGQNTYQGDLQQQLNQQQFAQQQFANPQQQQFAPAVSFDGNGGEQVAEDTQNIQQNQPQAALNTLI